MKEKIIEFYVNKFNYLTSFDETDVSFLPPIIRRRLSNLDKAVISLLNKTICENTQNIVFSSRFGEEERLLKIIEQYTIEKEVSPNTFSGSVHNYPVGFFLLNSKKPIPYNALSAAENTISSGILSTIISNFENVTFCYCDIYNDNLFAFAFSISKNKSSKEKYKLIIKNNKSKNDTFENYVEFFKGNLKNINADIFSIEKVENEN